jgi:hypothetical protein
MKTVHVCDHDNRVGKDDKVPSSPTADPIKDPTRHCFREDSPTDLCRDCGHAAAAHTGCDCEN